MVTSLKEVQGKLSNLVNITDATPRLGSPYISNPTLRNFEPRIGFAWDPFGNGKTAVRGGGAIFDVLPLPGYFILQNNQAAPFFKLGTVNLASTAGGQIYKGGLPLIKKTTQRSASRVGVNPPPN